MKFINLVKKSKNKKIGLALGSGGARGIAHIGVIKALEEAGVKIDYLAGVSMGAMIGAGYAATRDVQKLESIALATDWKKLFSMLHLGMPTVGMINGDKIQKFVISHIGDINISETKIPFAIVAADLKTKERVVFREGSIAGAIRASISFPFIFVPCNYGGRFLLDGTLVDPVPVKLVKEMGADFVIAVNLFSDLKEQFSNNNCDGDKGRVKNDFHEQQKTNNNMLGRINQYVHTPNIVEIGMRAITIMEKHLAIPQLQEADMVITPRVEDIGILDFMRTRELIARGEEASQEILAGL